MQQHQYETLLEQADAFIELLTEHEDELYVTLELAHQMRDELALAEPYDLATE
jgi:hypothetical protein